jgi:hypothetical protein
MTDPKEIVAAGVKGAMRGGVVGASVSVIGGAALSTAPVHLLWFIPVATTTVLSMPVVISAGAVGAVAYGGFSAYRTYRTQRSNDLLIEEALKSGRKQRNRKTSQ